MRGVPRYFQGEPVNGVGVADQSGDLTRQALRNEDGTFRRDIVRAIAQRVEIKSKTEIEVSGCRVELIRSMAVTSGSQAAAVAVPAREPEWRPSVDETDNYVSAAAL